ncbi:hypothetical protein ABHF91_01405 [Pseudaeromonas sp. ZJS20]|uniref:hypothetical protein n=1 Tax=Pseudaeromonas aegiceratis TaxID=3153928 RepID=UPI00390C6C67
MDNHTARVTPHAKPASLAYKCLFAFILLELVGICGYLVAGQRLGGLRQWLLPLLLVALHLLLVRWARCYYPQGRYHLLYPLLVASLLLMAGLSRHFF